MNNSNEEIINGANPSIIWTQYMDFLSEYGRQMKSTYTKRMRVNQPITWSELDVVNKQIHDKLDYLMTWSEKFNQNKNTTQQQNNPQVQPTNESERKKINKVHLSESLLRRVIKESVKKVLYETSLYTNDPYHFAEYYDEDPRYDYPEGKEGDIEYSWDEYDSKNGNTPQARDFKRHITGLNQKAREVQMNWTPRELQRAQKQKQRYIDGRDIDEFDQEV